MSSDDDGRLPGSFRDPAGFVFQRDGTFFRQVHHSYEANLVPPTDSGLYVEFFVQARSNPNEAHDIDSSQHSSAVAVVRPPHPRYIWLPSTPASPGHKREPIKRV